MNLAEWGVVGLVALAVFSPKHLPELARTLSKTLLMARKLSHEVKNTLDQAAEKTLLEEKEQKAKAADAAYEAPSKVSPHKTHQILP